jgi:hypothetical protein
MLSQRYPIFFLFFCVSIIGGISPSAEVTPLPKTQEALLGCSLHARTVRNILAMRCTDSLQRTPTRSDSRICMAQWMPKRTHIPLGDMLLRCMVRLAEGGQLMLRGGRATRNPKGRPTQTDKRKRNSAQPSEHEATSVDKAFEVPPLKMHASQTEMQHVREALQHGSSAEETRKDSGMNSTSSRDVNSHETLTACKRDGTHREGGHQDVSHPHSANNAESGEEVDGDDMHHDDGEGESSVWSSSKKESSETSEEAQHDCGGLPECYACGSTYAVHRREKPDGM